MIDNSTPGLPQALQFGAPPPNWSQPPSPEASSASPSFSTLYAFGDSLSDVGNDYAASDGVLPTPVIYSDGRFSNGNLWLQDLAKQLGLGPVKASLDGGKDFAYGGAETGGEVLHSVLPIDLPSQFAQFLVDDPHPEVNALYTLSIGANDVIDAISAYASNPSEATTDVQQAVNNEISFIGDLATVGARNFSILNVPDLGKTPAEARDSAVATQLSSLYNNDLFTDLQALATKDNLSIHLVDTFALLDFAVADPSAFGLKNVTKPVWTGNYYNPLSGHLNAHGAAQDKYLFFDHLHPTETGHEAIAAQAYAGLSVNV